MDLLGAHQQLGRAQLVKAVYNAEIHSLKKDNGVNNKPPVNSGFVDAAKMKGKRGEHQAYRCSVVPRSFTGRQGGIVRFQGWKSYCGGVFGF